MRLDTILLISAVLTLIVAAWTSIAARQRDVSRVLAHYQGQPLESAWQKGAKLTEQAAGSASALENLRWNLRWAQRDGGYRGQALGTLLLMMLVYGMLGCVLPVLYPAPVAWLAPVLMALFPIAALQRKGDQARKRAIRAIPEVATLVAAELSANVSPEQALGRASQIPGPLTVLIQEAIDASQESSQPLFSREDTAGILRVVFTEARLPALRAFATQLDLVAEKGVEGALLMSEIARSLAREHRERVLEDTEKLDGRLTVAVAIFYFIPMFVLIVGSFFAGVLTSM